MKCQYVSIFGNQLMTFTWVSIRAYQRRLCYKMSLLSSTYIFYDQIYDNLQIMIRTYSMHTTVFLPDFPTSYDLFIAAKCAEINPSSSTDIDGRR